MPQKGFQRISDLLLIFGLFFLSNVSAFFYLAWLTPEFVFFEAVLWLMLAAISVWILNKNNLLSNFFEILRKNWAIFPFLIFSGLSIFWSIYWEISLSRWLILLCTITTGGYIGLRYDMKEIVRSLSVFGIYILLLSSMLVFFVPYVGVMNYYTIQGAWKGLYWHKGHMGLIAAFINIMFLIMLVYSLQSKDKKALLWGIFYVFSLLFVSQTDSVAAYITVVFLHGLILLGLILLKFGKYLQRVHYLIFLVVLIFASLILYINIDHVFSILNRSPTLTGRIPMWHHLFDTYLSKRPLGGYGFNAFWYIEPYRVEMGLAAGYPDPIVISDNGFIDILINTGYVGLFLFLIFYLSTWWRSIKYAMKANDINGLFPVILMSFTLIANISWSLIFENEGFFMLTMVSVLFCVSAGVSIGRESG
jgi:exopolysaccharide production protein ExoQ